MKFDQDKMDAKEIKPVVEQVTLEDVEKLFVLDAVNVNKFYVIAQADGLIRICVADTDPSGKIMVPRFTMSLSIASFSSLVQLLSSNMQSLIKAQKAQANALKLPTLPPTAEKIN